MITRVDAIVVGLGASGGLVATELARAGMKVVGLEKGRFYKQADFQTKFDEIRYYCRSAIVPHMASDPITWRRRDGEEAVVLPWASNKLGLGDPFQTPPSIGTGGGTMHWGAAAFRFREHDFRMRSAIVERFSESALPKENTLVDWPIDYKTLEPYYDRVEWDLGVGGLAGNIKGEVISGGNPFEAPRSRGYPMPPLTRAAADKSFVKAASRLGYHPFPTPAAIATIDYKGRSACVNCGFCHGYPCHVGAKITTHEIIETVARETDNLEVRPFARAFRVNRNAGGVVKGYPISTLKERIVDLEADKVFLGCYAFENARLLLVSGINQMARSANI